MAGESFDVLTSPPSGDTDFPNVAKAAEEAGKIVDQLDTPLVIPETPVIEVEEPEEPAELTTIHNFEDPMAVLGLKEEEDVEPTDWKTEGSRQAEKARENLKNQLNLTDEDLAVHMPGKPVEGIRRLSEAEDRLRVINKSKREEAESAEPTAYGVPSIQEQIADIENDLSPEDIPASGTEVTDWKTEVSRRADNSLIKDMPDRPLRRLAEAEDRLRVINKSKETENVETPAVEEVEAPEKKSEALEAAERRIAELEDRVKALEARLNTEPKKVEIGPDDEKSAIEVGLIHPESELAEEVKPVGGEPWTEGAFPNVEANVGEPVGHEALMAGLDAYEEYRQENLTELNKLKEKREGREAATKGSFWERAKALGSRGADLLSERMKGILFGYWDVHQAEKVRLAGRGALDSVMGPDGIKQETGRLSHDDAYEEAKEMDRLKRTMIAAGKTPGNASTKEFYDTMSESISEEKNEHNEQVQEQLISNAIQTIKIKTAGYKTFTGKRFELSEAKTREIEDKLRNAIGDLRNSQLKTDKDKFKEVVRNSIDPKWALRYVVGGIEFALVSAGAYYLVPMAVKGALGGAKGSIGQVAHSVTSGPVNPALRPSFESVIPSETGSKPLTSNLWNMAKEMLKAKGLNPTDTQIMDVTKQLAIDNSVAVEKWGLAGNLLDTKIPVGTMFKIAGATAKIARMMTGV